MYRTVAFIGVALLAAATSRAQAAAKTIPDAVSCPACSIGVTPLVRLGTNQAPGLVASSLTRAVRDKRGRFYVYRFDGGDEISVFDRNGEFLRTLGREGRGPGEFQGLMTVRVDDDGNIFAFDRARRANVFSANYELLRSFYVDARPNNVLLMRDGEMNLVSEVATPDSIGFPFHRLDSDGHLKFSFGPGDGRVVPSEDYARVFNRATANATRDRLWSVDMTSYLIERWSAEGERELALQRAAAWFPVRTTGPVTLVSPLPFAVDLQEGNDGFLWVLIMVPDGDWEVLMERDGRRSAWPDEDYWDSVIEVIDVDAGTLVARTRVPQYLRFVDKGLVGGVANVGLDSYVDIFRVELTRSAGRR